MNELPTPPDAATDPQAMELLRAWLISSDEGVALHCALQSDAFDEAGPWGEVLADVVHHIAHARHQRDGSSTAETMRRIRDVFEAEVKNLIEEEDLSGGEEQSA